MMIKNDIKFRYGEGQTVLHNLDMHTLVNPDAHMYLKIVQFCMKSWNDRSLRYKTDLAIVLINRKFSPR